MEKAPEFLGNLSKYPDGIYGSASQIEQFALASMDFEDEPSTSEKEMVFGNCNNKNDIHNAMDELERKFGSTESREEHKRRYSNQFKTFVKNQIKDDEPIETMSECKLADCLRQFYFSLRRNDNKPYKPASLICIRAGIANYLTDAPVSRAIDILHGCVFKTANNMLKSMVGFWLDTGDEDIQHYDPIEFSDEAKMYNYFDRNSPTRLQDEVWYIVVSYLGMRGREGMRNLKKSSLESKVDSNNKRYWMITGPQKTKNNKASLSAKQFTSVKQSRIYEDPESGACPYEAISLYLGKIQQCEKDTLFPKPRSSISIYGEWYYRNQVLGKDMLGGMMARISKQCNLSRIYTNHCVRATYIKTLKDVGFTNEEICSLTGHKDERSVARYDKRQTDRALHKLSNGLSMKRKRCGTETQTGKQAHNKMSCSSKSSDNIVFVENEQNDELAKFSQSSIPVSNFMQKSYCQSLFNNCTFNNCSFS